MTSTDLDIRHEPREMAVLTNEQLQYIASTEFVPPGLRGNLPAILACVATGRALGIADMSALRSIHIIDGKATFSAELMVQLVRRAGHSIQGEVSDGSATVKGKRADNEDEMAVTWTLQMAERAGLLKKQNWVRYPEAMLWARAASQLCRMLFADCFAGATYTPEELDGPSLAGEPRAERAASKAAKMSVPDAHPLEDVEQPSPAESSSSQMTELAGETWGDAFGGAADPAAERVSLSDAQRRKLDVLVGQLRDAGRLHTEHLFQAVGRMRDVDPDDLARAMPGAVDDEGALHYSPLRDTLSRAEASDLIDRLSRLQENVAAAK